MGEMMKWTAREVWVWDTQQPTPEKALALAASVL